MTTVIHLAISRDILITSNMRLHWAEKARKTRVIREMAWVMCKHPKQPHIPTATCDVVVKWADRRRRDAESIVPTVKAAIDGCVDAELLTDDSDKYLKKVSYSNSDQTHDTPGIACYLTLTFTEVAP